MKFALLHGHHCEPHPTEKVSYSPGNAPIAADIRYEQSRDAENPTIIETERDLCALFNQPGTPPKFRRMDDYVPDGYELRKKDEVDDDLESLSVKDLVEYAQSEEIDLKGRKTKAEIIKIIRAYGLTAPAGV